MHALFHQQPHTAGAPLSPRRPLTPVDREQLVHWMLDVNFAEDQSRIRKEAGPEIASLLRQLALMILKHDAQLKGSLRGKRKIAGWSNDALETLLLTFTRI